MTIREYFAAAGSGFSDGEALVVGQRLDELGPTTAREFVDDARADDAPTHQLFEWDPVKAHPIYLEDRARRLMAMVRVRIVAKGGEERAVRAFPAVSDKIEGSPRGHLKRYTSWEIVRTDPDKSAEVLQEALGQIQAWQSRYCAYRDTLEGFDDKLGGIFAAIEAIEESGIGDDE